MGGASGVPKGGGRLSRDPGLGPRPGASTAAVAVSVWLNARAVS